MSEAKIWGIHGGATGDADPLFLQHDVVAIGWAEMGDPGKLKANREAFKAAVIATYLGNAGFIERLRDAFWPNRKLFPVLLRKVIYCGTHCGDHLALRDVAKLAVELDRLKSYRIADKTLDKHLHLLRRKLEKLVRGALRIKKPIAF